MSDRQEYDERAALIGTNVRALRRTRGMTQDELAAAVGITKSHVCRLEQGNRGPKRSTLVKLAEALDVEPDALDGTTLETRSTVWRLEHLRAGEWEPLWPDGHFPATTEESAQAVLASQREGWGQYEWRAVRVETIETVEVW